MAHHVEREIATICHRQRAFDFVADFSTTQEWDPESRPPRGSETVRFEDQVGASFELVSRFGSTEQTIVYEIGRLRPVRPA